jgi:hypothetical protein
MDRLGLLAKISGIAAIAICCVSGLIVASTPPYDKDSHFFMLFFFLIVATPLGLLLAIIASVNAYRRKSGLVVAIGSGLVSLLPALWVLLTLTR